MKTLNQSPADPAFVQNPYPVYAHARALGPLVFWADYDMPAAFGHAAVHALLRDRRFGREQPAELVKPTPAHLAPFMAVETHSMLEAEPPRHTRLRGLVLRAFTRRRISALAPEIAALCHRLLDDVPADTPFDLLTAYCTPIPVIVIANLLGVPADKAPDLLAWSHDMVAMYQASRTHETEQRAARAAADFSAFLRDYIDQRRSAPAGDLITDLIAAEEDGTRLSTDELIATCILLLNAGHEATVHALANGTKTLLENGADVALLSPDRIAPTVEELLRYDPPLHMFTRYALTDVTVFGHDFRRGDMVGLMLGAANRDPEIWAGPDQFDPARAPRTHNSFGGGLHFCIGAPLARLEMQIALPILFARLPDLRLTEPPTFADTYHFHGLNRLMVSG